MRPVTSGSSEKYSKIRPPRGSRTRFAAPPSRTLNPLPLASAPTVSPCRRASDEIPAGRQREVGGHRRRRVARPYVPRVGDAELGVGLLQGGNAEPRDAGDEARRADRALGFGLAAPGRARGRRGRATASPAVSSVSRAVSARDDELPLSSPHGRGGGRRREKSEPACGANKADHAKHRSGAPCRRTNSAEQLHRRCAILPSDGARGKLAPARRLPSMERYVARNQTGRRRRRRADRVRCAVALSRARDASSRAGRHVRSGPRRPGSASTG